MINESIVNQMLKRAAEIGTLQINSGAAQYSDSSLKNEEFMVATMKSAGRCCGNIRRCKKIAVFATRRMGRFRPAC